jgi:hypothetical protein
MHQEGMVQTDFPKLVDDDQRVGEAFILQQIIEDGRLAASQKACEY